MSVPAKHNLKPAEVSEEGDQCGTLWGAMKEQGPTGRCLRGGTCVGCSGGSGGSKLSGTHHHHHHHHHHRLCF